MSNAFEDVLKTDTRTASKLENKANVNVFMAIAMKKVYSR